MFAGAGLAAAGMVAVAGAVPASAAVHHPAWHTAKTFGNNIHLSDVVAVSRTEAWAFGGEGRYGNTLRSVALHWRGHSWTRVPLPKGVTGAMGAGAVVSSHDVWAETGGDEDGDDSADRILHWDGHRWSIKRILYGYITGITAIGPKDVWAFGRTGAGPGIGTWHYNGRTWRQTAKKFGQMYASAISPHDIWAAGQGLGTNDALSHYDGHTWRGIELLPPSKREAGYGLYAESAHSVWVALCPYSAAKLAPSLMHWNGKSWRGSPTPGSACLGKPVPDGRGGLWFSEPGSGYYGMPKLAHRSRNGAWTTTTLHGLGSKARVYLTAHIPGTAFLWGVSQQQDSNAILEYS
jgi:hypothetical protein